MAGFVPRFVINNGFHFIKLRCAIISVFFILFFSYWFYSYICLEGVGAVKRSFVLQLKDQPRLKNYSSYDINCHITCPYEVYNWAISF